MKAKNNVRNFLSIGFYLDKIRPNEKGQFAIYVRLKINDTNTSFSIRRWIHPDNWGKKGEIVGNSAELKEIKGYKERVKAKFSIILEDLLKDFTLVTAGMIRNTFEGVKIEPKTEQLKTDRISFFTAFKEFILREKELVGIDTSDTTVNRFDLIRFSFAEFLASKDINPENYLLTDLDKKIVLEFSHYLKTVKGNSHNTAMKKLERLRKFVKYCVDYKLMEFNPFFDLRVTYKKTKREKLSEEELYRLIDKDLSHCKRLEFVRDMFVFVCFTGLAYGDMASLERKQIERQSDGSYVIYKHRKKTDEPACVPLMEMPLDILRKYCDLDKAQSGDFVFDMNSNEKMNAYLKELSILAGIDKNLTTHVARHTCASILLSNGVPLAAIQRMLGHASSSTTEIYAEMFGMNVKKEIMSVSDKFKRKGAFSHKNMSFS